MSLIKWEQKYSVDVGMFNDQHKKLIDIINDLFDSMKIGKSNEKLGEIFTSLIDYTKYHFKDEEDMMKKYFYPDYLTHKKEHDVLTEKVLEYKAKFDNKEILISIELLNFIKEWLMNHIMQTDKKYGVFFNSKGLN